MDIRAFFGPPGGKSKPKNKNDSEKKDEQNSNSSSSANGSRSQGRGKNKKEPKASKAKATSSSEDNEAEVKKQTKKSRKEQVIKVGSDSDEEPLPSKLRKDTVVEAKKKTTKKKRSSYFDESDEEEVLPPKLMKESKDGKKKLQDTKKVSPSKSKSSPSPLKETTAADFFGASPIERTSSRKAIAVKRKQPSDEDTMKCSSEPKVVTSDDKDSKDGKRPAKKRKDDSSEQSASKQKQSTAKTEPKSTPASKLAKAAVTTKFTVAETPEKSPKKALPEKRTHMTTAKKGSPKEQITPSKPEKTTDKEEMVIPPSLEKKKSGYRSFMMRDGPRTLGSKEIPQGAENCFEGLTFVITGVLDAIERDDAVDLIQRYGGKVTSAVSKKTSYLIVGRDPGESKTKKADQVGTKKIDEDGLLELVRTKPGKKSVHEVQCEKTVTPKKSKSNSQQSEASQSPQKGVPSGPVSTPTRVPGSSPSLDHGHDKSLLWVDKYRPSTLKHIIGQQGDKSNMRKLLKWLKDWHSNRNKPHNKSSFFQKDQDGKIFKAALLSGPPGVGKTTTSQLVCQELGFSYIEMNASDSRNKKTLEQSVSQLLNNKSMDGFLTGTKTEAERHALIMDEVDGMAGNEDRGGMQELIALIKNSKIPVICMCNDRNSPKIRSLANYCFDLKFQRPRVEQIKGAMMSIAFKEGLKIPAPAMDQIITGANQDIRQVLNNLAMWTATEKVMSYDQAKADASKAQKDIKMGSFDAVRKLLSGAESSKLSINEKSDMFFSDYSIMPLFVQENYLSVMPNKAGGNVKKTLELMSKTADALCDGDLVENHIRSGGQWSLLPTQAMFSCVIPSDLISGGMGGRIDFPQWLGKNSKKGRISRILQELQVHLRLSASGSKMAVNLDYVPHLRRAMTGPLMTQESDEISSGVARVIGLMEQYDLTKDDWDSIVEVGHFEGHRDPVASIPSKVKSAFTRAYNKSSHMRPYAMQSTVKKGHKGAGTASGDLQMMEEGEVDEEEAEEVDDRLENNAMIKVQKGKPGGGGGGGKRGKGVKSESQETSASRKGKGKGKGKGKSDKK